MPPHKALDFNWSKGYNCPKSLFGGFIMSILDDFRFLIEKAKLDVLETKRKNERRGEYIETTIRDENGDLISQSTRRLSKPNRGGFVLSYTAAMQDFIIKTTSPTVIRVFLYIAHRQGFGANGIFGYRCSRKHLREVLHVDKKTIYRALEYLESEFLIVENRFDGQLEFMVNPNYVTCGTDRKRRDKEWSARWQMYFQNKARLAEAAKLPDEFVEVS